MRMRRKKNLDERLAACEGCLISVEMNEKDYHKACETKQYLDFERIFGNNNPIHLEIGCGKGQFARTLAQQNPDINIFAIEKSRNVIVEACERTIEQGLDNLKYMDIDAHFLTKYFPEKSVSRIYLNFSCPFPKARYASHRLTNNSFLEGYREIMASGARIFQKTDNRAFFEYSIEQLSEFGFTLGNISLDLHNSDFQGNIVTEYESRFTAQGLPIYRLEAYLK